ncbi:MAG: FHA domain-containing protein [Tepidiformaceae bacterium]
MSSSGELLLLRLALILVIFAFVAFTALSLRRGLTAPAAAVRTRPSGQRPGSVRLVVTSPGETGLAPGAAFTVAGMMTLGRDSDNGIVLGDPSISNQHARLERVRDGWRIVDLGSTNGTFVNGRGVEGGGVLLRGGEQISVGAVTLRFGE